MAPSTAPVRVSPALPAPFYFFTNLSPSTKYTVSVACIKPDSTRVDGLATLPMTTPAPKCAGAVDGCRLRWPCTHFWRWSQGAVALAALGTRACALPRLLLPW